MELDYRKLGFKAGIEIHQELNTNKLFCSCSTALHEKKLASETIRKLRAVAGETGEIDLASAYEQFRDRVFIYHGYEHEACLVDLDEEPPHIIDKEAFEIALGVAKLFKLKIPDTICVMRKTVTDGSAITGFQRTMLIGTESSNSHFETSQGRVKILQLNLEEDACKIEKKDGNTVHYSLSRLGIPLLELGTDASIKDPVHFKEVAVKIGSILRSFNVKRGIGTIRQDVNVSIKEGARIEVKGWQDLKKLEELVINEVYRQYNLIQIKKELQKRKLKQFNQQSKDVTDIFIRTKAKIIFRLIKDNAKVYALVLPKFAGLLKKDLCPGKTFGRELSEYAKAYGTKGMIHTDEDITGYHLEKEFTQLKKLLKTNSDDLILIVAEKEHVAKKAINSVYKRALYCLKGVPEETRIPNHKDATTSYARPLPGAHRLYPETDIPNITVTKELLDSIEIPELLSNKINRYAKQYSIEEALAKELINMPEFEEYVKRFNNLKPSFIAQTLIESPKEIKKRYDKGLFMDEFIEEIFEKVNKKEINKDAVFEILVAIAQGKKIDYSRYKSMSDSELEKEIKKIVKDNKNIPINAVIGKVMAKLRGKAPGEKIVNIVKSLVP